MYGSTCGTTCNLQWNCAVFTACVQHGRLRTGWSGYTQILTFIDTPLQRVLSVHHREWNIPE